MIEAYRSGQRVTWNGNGPHNFSQDVDAPGRIAGMQFRDDLGVTVYYVTLDDSRHVTAGASQIRPLHDAAGLAGCAMHPRHLFPYREEEPACAGEVHACTRPDASAPGGRRRVMLCGTHKDYART